MLDINVAIAQLELFPGDLDGKRERIVDAIETAAASDADLVVLPELAASGYRMSDWRSALRAAQSIPGPTTREWQDLAARHSCHIVGGVLELAGNALFNSVAVVGPAGLLAVYRKLHLWGEERLLFAPGDLGLPVIALPFGRVGIIVCYDLRFPESLRILALQGADLVAIPTAWAPGYDRSPSPDGIIDQVRAAAVQANINQVFVAAASRVGADGDLGYLGSSVIIDPYGRLLYGPASRDDEVVEVVSIDLSEARRAKVRDPLITPLADRRTDVYGDLLGYRPDAHPQPDLHRALTPDQALARVRHS
jgi:predicted amidohydrolase